MREAPGKAVDVPKRTAKCTICSKRIGPHTSPSSFLNTLQYGNVGTSNPYTNASRPGTAAAAVGKTNKAPVSGTLDTVPQLPDEYRHVQDGLLSVVAQLKAAASNPMERKQAAESEKSAAIFIKTLAMGGVDADVAEKVGSVLRSLQGRDYATASSIVTSLVSNHWKDHKDWLKGLKFLVQLAGKKQI